MKKIMQLIGSFVLIAIVTYVFLALCNWGWNPKEWNGFSRFILGAEAVMFLIAAWYEL